MASTLGTMSAKLNEQILKTKKTTLTEALVTTLKDTRQSLEKTRTYMLAQAVKKTATSKTLQKDCKDAAVFIKEAIELVKMARPFQK